MSGQEETANPRCYRCGEELDGRGFPVDLNTGKDRACKSCYEARRRYFSEVNS